MGRLGLIGGHSILGSEPLHGFAPSVIETERGTVELLERGGAVLLQRHGLSRYTTAAQIDHRRNLAGLAALGCDRLLAIGSVGSLRADLGVGSFLSPDDFIALHLGISFSDGHEGERVPGFDRAWRTRVLAAWAAAGAAEVVDGGIYWQAIGPRFETPAEIGLIAAHADVIGMTIAGECILAGELGIPYAAICVVDNLANGIAAAPLSVADFEAGKAANRARLWQSLEAVLPELAGAEPG